jgi:hypothetical protein
MFRASAMLSTGRHEMARQSYLTRVAGSVPARSPQLTAVTGVAVAQPAALSSLLQHLSSPAAVPQPPTGAAPSAITAAVPADALDERPIEARPRPPQPQVDSIRPDKALQASVSPVAEPAARFQAPHHSSVEESVATESAPKTAAAVSLSPPQEIRYAPLPGPPDMADAVQPKAAVTPAPVHVHIGTVEVRTKAPQANAASPAATAIPAATFSAPPRGYGWGYGLGQR